MLDLWLWLVPTSSVGLAWSCASLATAAGKALVVVLLPEEVRIPSLPTGLSQPDC